MNNTTAPALLPALAAVAGVAAALAGSVRPGLALALGLASLALLDGLSRRLLVGAAAGLLIPTLTSAPLPRSSGDPIRAGDVVELVGRVISPWSGGGNVRSSWLEAEFVIQRRRVSVGGQRWLLQVPREVEAPAVGSVVRVKGIAARSPGFWNRVRLAPGPWRVMVESRELLHIERGPRGHQRLASQLRARIESAFGDLRATGVGVGLARALLLGDASCVPITLSRGLKRLGLSHILSVSGLHMTLLVAAVYVLTRSLSRLSRFSFSAAGVLTYALVVGAQPAAWRAAGMALVASLALCLKRPPAPANALAVTTVLLLLLEPRLLEDLGFQLSVAATAALLGLAPAWASRWALLPRWLAQPLAASCAAQLVTLPLTLPRFAVLPLLSPLANLLLVPWASLVLVADLAWGACALASPDLARRLRPLLELAAAPLDWAASWSGARSWIAIAHPTPFEAVVMVLFLGLLLWRPRWWVLLGISGALALLVIRPNQDVGLRAVFLDVGQGDATLLRAGRAAVLVDGGGWEAGDFASSVLVPALAAEGVRRLDAVALTHGDSDHCQGLLGLVDYMPFDQLWLPRGEIDTECARLLVKAQESPPRRLGEGELIVVGEWRFEVLAPPQTATEGLRGNDASLVLRATADATRILLTGDVERRGELNLFLRHGDALQAQVLKVPHHGSGTSSTERLLRAVGARVAVISAGRNNRYGHPSLEVLRRLQSAGIHTFRTDRDGAVEVVIGSMGRWRVHTRGATD